MPQLKDMVKTHGKDTIRYVGGNEEEFTGYSLKIWENGIKGGDNK